MGAYHDDRHPCRGVVVLRCSVKVRPQFTCDLHLHVVPNNNFILQSKAGSEVVRCYFQIILINRCSKICMCNIHANIGANGAVSYRDPRVGEDVLCCVSSLNVNLQHLSNQLLQHETPSFRTTWWTV